MKIFKRILLVLLLLGLVGSGTVYFIYINPIVMSCHDNAKEVIASINEDTFDIKGNTKIYDDKNVLLGEFFKQKFSWLSFEDTPSDILNGFIATEDSRYFEHSGVDFKALTRATLLMVKNKGEVKQGGSTITQQLVKNKFLTNEKSYKRKITEIFIALDLEKEMSKEEIFEAYINTLEYGNNCKGIYTASTYYFSKKPKDLTLAESATLVGLINNPTLYNPNKNIEGCTNRRNLVLKRMYTNGYITAKQYTDSVKSELTLKITPMYHAWNPYTNSFAIHEAALILMENDGFKFQYTFHSKEDYDYYKEKYNQVYSDTVSNIRSGGYTIYTSFNNDLQYKLQSSVDTILQSSGKPELQGASALIDNRTNEVKAIVGGKGCNGEFNRAYQAARQPGSSIKPVLTYGPAITLGLIDSSTMFIDEKVDGGPKNVDNKYQGKISLNQALIKSKNTVAYYVFSKVTPAVGVQYLNDMLFSTLSYQDTDNYSLGIGGFTNGVTPIDLTRAYSTFSNSGVYNRSTCIKKIVDNSTGDIIMPKAYSKRVYNQKTIDTLIPILRNVVKNSTPIGYSMPGIDIIGKTGTTNDNKDGWFAYSTPEYSMATWVGCDTPKQVLGLYGSSYPARIAKDFIEHVYTSGNSLKFNMSEVIDVNKYDPSNKPDTKTTKPTKPSKPKTLKVDNDVIKAPEPAQEVKPSEESNNTTPAIDTPVEEEPMPEWLKDRQ